jgi:Phage integrase, N-terminal SAM-like domain
MIDEPISPLRQRLIEDMTVRRFQAASQKDYIRHVKNFADFLGRSPDTASSEDLRRYQLHMTRCRLAASTRVSSSTRRSLQSERRRPSAASSPTERSPARTASPGVLRGKHLEADVEWAARNGLPLITAIVVDQPALSTGAMSDSALSGFIRAARKFGHSVTDERAFLRDQQQAVFNWGRAP